jgi:hypothetical protein
MPYLSGFLSEKYNYTSDEMKERVEQRIKQYASTAARNTINGYASVAVIDENIRMKNTKTQYVLLPVWMLNYRYLSKNYVFALNGQTGKVVGNLPISKGKMAGWFTGVAAVAFAVVKLISYFIL